jgi:hypothetical protein
MTDHLDEQSTPETLPGLATPEAPQAPEQATLPVVPAVPEGFLLSSDSGMPLNLLVYLPWTSVPYVPYQGGAVFATREHLDTALRQMGLSGVRRLQSRPDGLQEAILCAPVPRDFQKFYRHAENYVNASMQNRLDRMHRVVFQAQQALTRIYRARPRLIEALDKFQCVTSEQIDAAYQSIMDLALVDKVEYRSGDEGHPLVVLTKPIITTDARTGCHHLLGSFEVMITTEGAITINNTDRHIETICGLLDAPHVLGNVPCFGNASDAIAQAVATRQWDILVTLILRFLATPPNTRDRAGTNIYRWPTCTPEGEIIEAQGSEDPGEGEDDDDSDEEEEEVDYEEDFEDEDPIETFETQEED